MNKTTANIAPANVTPEMIADWKAQGFDVHRVRLGKGESEKVCYMRSPTRKELSYATSASATDPLKFNEVLIDACWLAGDEDIKTHGGLSISLGNKLTEIIGIVEAELEKL